jgi:hypothetical protein
VGGASESEGGFAWQLDGDEWTPEASLPADVTANAALWKVFGTTEDDAWFVGSNGVSLHWDGDSLSAGDTGVGSSLFTVHANDDRYTAVRGLATGIIVEYRDGEWHDETPEPRPDALSGVCLDDAGGGFAVGAYGSVYERESDGWRAQDTGLVLNENLHAAWLDPEGGLWAVGGQTFAAPLSDGVLIYRGTNPPLGDL